MQILISFISGLIMAMGLIISGMVNPQKVISFLDVFGSFDPTLGFVMAGALAVGRVGFWLIAKTSKPCLCDSFDKPSKTKIDASLIIGSVLFGIGWGLAGFCPGPTIVGVALGVDKAIVFFIAMLVGMYFAKGLIALNSR